MNHRKRHICLSFHKQLYDIIDFKIGDKYKVVSANELGIDNQVLEFFAELLKDIVEKANIIDIENEIT